MDPLTALSLAGTVIQFVDFGSKLLAGTYELYKSNTGDLEPNAVLYLVACDLEDLIIRFSQPPSSRTVSGVTRNEQKVGHEGLESICKGAVKVAQELKERLESIRVRGPGKYKVWDSFAHAVMCAWSKDELERLTKRLSSFRDAINTRVLMSIR
jgi:glutamate/tyrosine decarboxylase-like PLP-dependent enzyme